MDTRYCEYRQLIGEDYQWKGTENLSMFTDTRTDDEMLTVLVTRALLCRDALSDVSPNTAGQPHDSGSGERRSLASQRGWHVRWREGEEFCEPAIWALLLGMLSLLGWWLLPMSFPLALAGFVLGRRGKNCSDARMRGFAITGIVVSVVALLFGIVTLCMIIDWLS